MKNNLQNSMQPQDNQTNHSQNISLNQARDILRQFVKERDWDKYHTPRNLILALVGEVGQLAEIFQWRGEVPKNLQGMSQKDKIHVGQELADIFNYLIRFADVCGINLNRAFVDKMGKNIEKYPAQEVKESIQKYYQLKQKARKQRIL